MDFTFPRSGIFLTTIPKTGCTSAINFFTALEVELERIKTNLFEFNSDTELVLSYPDRFESIHESGSPSKNFLSENLLKYENLTSIATYRDPYKRFASFWFDKVILLKSREYLDFALKKYDKFENLDLGEIRNSAKIFLEENSHDTQNLDLHVRPQFYFLSEHAKYDLYFETEALRDIPEKLANFSSDFQPLRKLDFPHFHSTQLNLEFFYDDELSFLVEKFYELDFSFIKNFSEHDFQRSDFRLSHLTEDSMRKIEMSRARTGSMNLKVERDELTRQRDELTRQRDELKQQRDELTQQRDELTQQRDDLISERDAAAGALSTVVNSRIWRFTKLYRKLRSHKP